MAINHIVRAGDCVSSLAESHGLFWETVWHHPNNAALKSQRKDPNILMPGDVVHIPDKQPHFDHPSTEARHQYVRKGVPAKLRVRLMMAEESPRTAPWEEPAPEAPQHLVTGDLEPKPEIREVPRKNTRYVLIIDGVRTEGASDGDGYVEAPISPTAKKGTLTIAPDTQDEIVIPLELGHLDPLDEVSGVKQRLANLGLNCGDTTDAFTPELAAALRAFQQIHGLEVTGAIDDATRDTLKTAHGS